MSSKESMLKLSMAMYMMDNSEMRDIMTLLVPHLKYVLGKYINFHLSKTIDVEKLPKEINEILGYERFPRTIVSELLKRLKKEKIVNYDKRTGWTLNSDLSEFVKEYEKSMKENDEEFEELIATFKKYLIDNCPRKEIKELTDKQISDRVFEYLVNHGLIISNHLETANIIKDDNKPFDYFFTDFIIESNVNNKYVINTITKMVEGAYLANAIYNYDDDFGIKKMGDLECYIDTSIMLYLLGLKEPEICDSYIEILNLYKSVGIKCKCLKSIVNEIRYIVSHYLNSDIHYGNRKLAYFDNSSSFEGEKSSFLNNLESNIKNLKIEIVGGEETFKRYCMKKSDIFNKLKEDIDSNIYYGKETALNTDVESIMYVLDKRSDFDFNYIKDAKSYFVTSNLNLVKAANKSLNVEPDRVHLSPIISIDYFTNLIWVFDMKINSNVTKKRILSVAHQSNIIKDGFIDRIESIFDEIKTKQINGYTYEQVMQDAFIINTIRKRVANNETSIQINDIKKAIEAKEQHFIGKGKKEGINETVTKHSDCFKEQYQQECEAINNRSYSKKHKLKFRIVIISTIILSVLFILLTLGYIKLKINHQLSLTDPKSVLILFFDILLAILSLSSLFLGIKDKSFFIHNYLYHHFAKKIDSVQNAELLKEKERYERNIKIIHHDTGWM